MAATAPMRTSPPGSGKRKKLYKARFEGILWITVFMIFVMLIGFNVMLWNLEQQQSSSSTSASQQQHHSVTKFVESSSAAATKTTEGGTTSTTTGGKGPTQPLPLKFKVHNGELIIPERNKTEEIEHFENPLLKILKHANIPDTPELRAKLPTWEQVVERFGSQAKIVGLETCPSFREQVPIFKRMVGPAGPFNSGTNLLYELLTKNCANPHKKDVVKWGVNWGKHQPAHFHEWESAKLEKRLNNSHYMPVVMVRDPYSWMQSMCKNIYTARWWRNWPHCPNIIATQPELKYVRTTVNNTELQFAGIAIDNDNYSPVRVEYKAGTMYHQSLVHMWRDWYEDYYQSKFPRLMIRLEDLVFHPESVVEQVCDCIGGIFAPEGLQLQGEAPESKTGGGHAVNPTDLTGAMIKHVFSNRTKGMNDADLQETIKILSSDEHSMMDVFGYTHPV